MFRSSLFVLMAITASAYGTSLFTADCDTSPASALETAVRSIRDARAGSTAVKATLRIRGTCRIRSPIRLTKVDSNVEWVGEQGATISGGLLVPASSWTKHKLATCRRCGTVWTAQLSSNAVDARQLYVDGIRANRTVMPFPQESASKNADGFVSPLAFNFSHNHGQAIEMLHQGTHSCNYSSSIQWAETRVPVASVKGNTFHMVEPAYSHSNNNGIKSC